jgi:coproporphyrinogen III oxidase-like Fe-S oxidoreductase
MSDLPKTHNVKAYLHGDRIIEFWNNYFANHKWEEKERINIYIDFPYCVSNCKYCMIQPANLQAHKNEIPIYLEKLLESMEAAKHLFPQRPIGTIAFGGGTASRMPIDTIRGIMEIMGPSWTNALVRKMEMHPRDISEDYLSFLINEMKVTTVSFGIQSFNPESNKSQNRIPCNINDLMYAVGRFHENKISVNIDLVALFNGETEKDWEIFRDDLRIVRDLIEPELFFTQVNYATQTRYYEHSLQLRKELKAFLETTDKWVYADERYAKLDMEDVQRYLDTTYFMVKPHYLKFLVENDLYTKDPRFWNYLAFGGNRAHKVFSLTAELDTIYTHYDFSHSRWVHELMDTVIPEVKGSAKIPTINVGRYIIPPYDPDNSLKPEKAITPDNYNNWAEV